MSAIGRANYDYRVSAVSNDELGDLTLFTKTLALTLRETQAFFADTLNNLPSFVLVLDPQGTILFANQTALRGTDLDLEQIKGQRLWAAYWLSFAPEVSSAARDWVAACAAGRTLTQETRWRGAGGRIIWVELRLHPLFDPAGGIKYLIPEGTDISARKATETELRLAATAFETHEALFIMDREARIQRVNRAFSRISGYGPGEVMGRRPELLLAPGPDRTQPRRIRQALARAGCWSGEIQYRRKDGDSSPGWLSIAAVADNQGQPTHFVASFLDLTDRKSVV
jgi:PAS domain S-box-containing protein